MMSARSGRRRVARAFFRGKECDAFDQRDEIAGVYRAARISRMFIRRNEISGWQ